MHKEDLLVLVGGSILVALALTTIVAIEATKTQIVAIEERK